MSMKTTQTTTRSKTMTTRTKYVRNLNGADQILIDGKIWRLAKVSLSGYAVRTKENKVRVRCGCYSRTLDYGDTVQVRVF